jgi:hypothetical protein
MNAHDLATEYLLLLVVSAEAAGELLGLGAEFTRDDVMRAFRERAHEHHPDTAIRRYSVVEARDRALMSAA